MIINHPPTPFFKIIRTGNYSLGWSGLRLKHRLYRLPVAYTIYGLKASELYKSVVLISPIGNNSIGISQRSKGAVEPRVELCVPNILPTEDSSHIAQR